MEKKNGICIQTAILFTFKEEWNSDAYYNMDLP